MPPTIQVRTHSYKREMAEVEEMSEVMGGSSFRTNRVSSGVRIANCPSSASSRRASLKVTYELDDLDEDPVVAATRQDPEQLRCQRQVIPSPLSSC